MVWWERDFSFWSSSDGHTQIYCRSDHQSIYWGVCCSGHIHSLKTYTNTHTYKQALYFWRYIEMDLWIGMIQQHFILHLEIFLLNQCSMQTKTLDNGKVKETCKLQRQSWRLVCFEWLLDPSVSWKNSHSMSTPSKPSLSCPITSVDGQPALLTAWMTQPSIVQKQSADLPVKVSSVNMYIKKVSIKFL